MQPEENMTQPEQPKFRVGHESDAWCGPCKRISAHIVIAMVDGIPKQVLCQSCGSRHNYRLEAGRSGPGGPGGGKPAVESRKLSPTEQHARKKQEELVVLSKELAAATEVRPFVRREVYKAGQIIEHPEYGRGKVENARRDTIMVRFSTGLKSLLIS